MRQQQAIVAASGPRTPINDPTSNRIGVPRNGGDSGIFTAAGRLRPLSSSTVRVRTPGGLQFCPMRQVVVGPAADDGAMRCSDRRRPPARLNHSASTYPISRRRPTAACLAVGNVRSLVAFLSPHGRSPPAVGRAYKTSAAACPESALAVEALYPKPRSAAMAKPARGPSARRPIGRVPTPEKHGRPESTQLGLHSGSRSPLAGWI